MAQDIRMLVFPTLKSDPSDFFLKVGSIVLLETLNSVFGMIYSYDRLVLNFGAALSLTSSLLYQAISSFLNADNVAPCAGDSFAQSIPTWRKHGRPAHLPASSSSQP